MRAPGRSGSAVPWDAASAAAGDLTVSGGIAADAVLAGGSVAFEQTALAGRDLVAAGEASA